MSIIDNVRAIVRDWILQDDFDNATRLRMERIAELRSYYDGAHKQQLRVKPNQYDDNITVNFCALIIDQAVSALVGDPADGQGLTWTFPSETTTEGADGKKVVVVPQQVEWLSKQWEAAKREIFLHDNALIGAETGFPCVKLVTDGAGNVEPINLDPMLLTVDTDPQNMKKITGYHIRYIVIENDRQVAYKEDTIPANPEATAWTIETKRQVGGKRWELVNPPVLWQYPFAPILAWKNLPCVNSVYGRSDIESIIALQNRYNYGMANNSKLNRLFAYPSRYGRNITAQIEDNKIDMGPDDLPLFGGISEIVQLPPGGDMPGSLAYVANLRELMFALSREVDTSLFKDKVGPITNMGLRLMYKNALEKLSTKRLLYGDAYAEMNRRMLVLGGFAPETCTTNWPSPLPVNVVEEITALEADQRMGLVSTQTLQEARGYNVEKENELMAKEKQTTQDAGSLLLQDFFKTGQSNRTNATSREQTA